MTALDTAPRDAGSAQQDLLARLAEPDIDLAAARAAFDLRRGRRALARRVVGCSAVVLVLAVLVSVLALRGGEDPDELVADRDDDVTTTSTSTTVAVATEVELAPVTAPPTTAVTTPSAPPVTAAQAPVTEAPTTTLPPNQPLQASLTVLTPEVAAGGVARGALAWSDADLGAGTPRHVVAWGDPILSTPVDTSPRAACDAPAGPTSGVDELQFRYSTPGTYLVRVTVETCGGQGAYAERVAVDAQVPITVVAPTYVDPDDPEQTSRGQSVVVFTPPRPGGAPWPPLATAAVELVPSTDPTRPVLLRDAGGPEVFTTSGPATVLVVPEGAMGAIRVRWTDPASCATTTSGDLAGEDGSVLSLPLAVAVC